MEIAILYGPAVPRGYRCWRNESIFRFIAADLAALRGAQQYSVPCVRYKAIRRIAIMSFIEDLLHKSLEADMYFTTDMPYNVRYEGHDTA